MMRITLMVLVCLLLCSLGRGHAGNPVSPLFHARLEATKTDWERGEKVDGPGGTDPTWLPSANPVSFCLGSVCLASYCIGSFCVSSGCVGSGCVGSTCIGSGCVASLCGGSGCVGSVCGGSACLGVSLCPQKCDGSGDGATNREGPDYNNLTYTWGPCSGM